MSGPATGFRAGVLTAVLICAAWASASAQNAPHDHGFYIGGGVGANFQEQNRFRGGGADSNPNYDTGYLGLLNFGYALGNGMRYELEPAYRHNDLDKIGGATGHGGTDIGSLMVNGIYDFDIGIPLLHGWQPHIGAGVGVARVRNRSAPHNGLLVTGDDTVPAFQAIAGIDYAITPAVKLGVDYRYFLAHNTDFHVGNTGARVKGGDFNDHAILLTFRYQFGTEQPHVQPAAVTAPPPATPAPPPPPMARSFTVYFDLDRATLTPAGREVVRQAAQNAKQDQVTRITVTGHTDTTGTSRHNQRLSERRAAAVRAELVADGVSPDQITTAGRGESDLAVPTAAGVAEPRNRRVVIFEGQPGS